MPRIRAALKHLNSVAERIDHKWDDPYLTRDLWLKMRG
jgi:hypothetical protein